MPLSTEWTTDNAYTSNVSMIASPKHTPTDDMREFVRNNSRRDSLLYNNRLWHGSLPRTEEKDNEYAQNRLFILAYFG